MWKISKFVGSSEHTLRAEVNLVSTTKEKKAWSRPPIQLHFQVRVAGGGGGGAQAPIGWDCLPGSHFLVAERWHVAGMPACMGAAASFHSPMASRRALLTG